MQPITSETHIWHMTCQDMELLRDRAKVSHCLETLEICTQRINTAIQTISTTATLTSLMPSWAPAPNLHTWKWKGDVYVYAWDRHFYPKWRREMIHSWAHEVKSPAVVLTMLSYQPEISVSCFLYRKSQNFWHQKAGNVLYPFYSGTAQNVPAVHFILISKKV